ncbi:MAG: hypothetical protein K2G15_06815, partial [Muribaculaceae bacterium]|nr:hypothetical protein [Muribaculaceae bacterium]
MNIILVDNPEIREALLPLTFTRPTALLPAGIGTIAERWALLIPEANISFLTVEYLQVKYPACEASDSLLIPGHIIPSPELAAKVRALAPGEWIQTSAGEVISHGRQLLPEPKEAGL